MAMSQSLDQASLIILKSIFSFSALQLPVLFRMDKSGRNEHYNEPHGTYDVSTIFHAC